MRGSPKRRMRSNSCNSAPFMGGGTQLRASRLRVVGAALCVGSALIASVARAEPDAELQAKIRRMAGADAVVYAVDGADRILVDIDADRAFLPASTIKILTAWIALQLLGPDYRFRTELFVVDDELFVRGGGDPFLVSEELEQLAASLAPLLGGRRLRGVVVDDSRFEPDLRIPGVEMSWRSYDALNSATAVNFNTISVARLGDEIVSGEPQTPLTPHGRTLARALRFEKSLRFRVGDDLVDVQRYAGELLAAFLRQAGVTIDDQVRAGKVPPGVRAVYVHANQRTLVDICREMLASSNNFVANQVFLTIGAEAERAPASVARSVRVAERVIERHSELRGIQLVEGSGLAYENRATAPALAALLKHFHPYRDLLREDRGSRHKTGTLKAVSSLAGYLESERYGTVRYALALPGGEQERRWGIVSTLSDHIR